MVQATSDTRSTALRSPDVSGKPILFSAPMVRAILAGEKTQTRRIMKPQPLFFTGRKYIVPNDAPKKFHDCDDIRECCPYGMPGDRLWVRETWGLDWYDDGNTQAWKRIVYRADGDKTPSDNGSPMPWRPSIFMPRTVSRITLLVTNVRIQQLQDISEEDARAEGVERLKSGRGYYSTKHGKAAVHFGVYHDYAKEAFADLWESINGDGSWNANPWVYAVSFERVVK